jgi:branched-chain amino acid transport system permease protein
MKQNMLHPDLQALLEIGLIAGVVTLFTVMVGMIQTFDEREVIAGIITLGSILLFAPSVAVGYLTAQKIKGEPLPQLVAKVTLVGVVSSLPLIAVLLIDEAASIRHIFASLNDHMVSIITFEQDTKTTGGLILILALTACSLVGGSLVIIPEQFRRHLLTGIGWVLGIGIMSELIVQVLRRLVGRDVIRFFFQTDHLKPQTAIGIFLVVVAISWLWKNQGGKVVERYDALPEKQQRYAQWGGLGVSTVLLFLLPAILGPYFSEVLSNVGLFVLMGLGLNIAVGLGGLLDLGYVVTFAVGAYTVGVLTSTGPLGLEKASDISVFDFWLAIPVAVVVAMFTGFILSLPVLKMRGDYLAITTLGFGEIIELLAKSDWLKPYVGGAQGILFIPKPVLFGYEFSGPREIYYIILVGCFIVVFIALRLNNSRTGRQWMALREDEDVARSMGIDTHQTKMLAFTLSAASGGLSGAIFAAKLGNIYPNSFDLLISINVLSLIIVGGMGSIYGVVVGALVLIGMPEMLREFAEYRLLLYGALLIVMMRARPEGLWPSAVRQREMHIERSATAVLTGVGDLAQQLKDPQEAS